MPKRTRPTSPRIPRRNGRITGGGSKKLKLNLTLIIKGTIEESGGGNVNLGPLGELIGMAAQARRRPAHFPGD